MLKKVLSTTPPHTHTFLFTGKFNIYSRIYWNMILQGGLLISDIAFGCDDLTYNPSLVCTRIEFTHSSFKHYKPAALCFREAMQSFVSEELDQQSWSCLWGVTTSHITCVQLAINCGKAECLAPVTRGYSYSSCVLFVCILVLVFLFSVFLLFFTYLCINFFRW